MGSTLRESFFGQHSPSGAHTQRGVGCSSSPPLQDPGLCSPWIQMTQVFLFPQTHPAKPKSDWLSPHDTAVHSAWREGAANKSVLPRRDVGSFPSQPALWQGLGLWVVNWGGGVAARSSTCWAYPSPHTMRGTQDRDGLQPWRETSILQIIWHEDKRGSQQNSRQTIGHDPQVTPLASKEVTARLVNSTSTEAHSTGTAGEWLSKAGYGLTGSREVLLVWSPISTIRTSKWFWL